MNKNHLGCTNNKNLYIFTVYINGFPIANCNYVISDSDESLFVIALCIIVKEVLGLSEVSFPLVGKTLSSRPGKC